MPQVSVIIPLYNEEPNVAPLHRKLLEDLDALGRSWEVVFINDGSTDGTGTLIDRIATVDCRFAAVHFRRNFGQTAAFSAGIRYAQAPVIVAMDGDLQNDPADIGRMLARLDEGYDLVSGWRRRRNDPLTKSIPSRLANSLVSFTTGVRLHDYGCSLKAYRRDAVDRMFLYGEMHRFIPALAAIAGARIGEIEVSHHPRVAGRSKYGLERTAKVLLDLLVVRFFMSFLNKPIHLFGGIGCLFMAGSLLAIIAAVIFQAWLPLFALAVALASLGILAVLLGILAEVAMRTYYGSQGKDAYRVLRVTRNASPPAESC